jgi:pyridoxal 5'-phosphate synthase pdxT subunit
VSVPKIGVLALQGDTREHLAALREAGAESMPVRRRSELDAVDGLVIPGGGWPRGFRPTARVPA